MKIRLGSEWSDEQSSSLFQNCMSTLQQRGSPHIIIHMHNSLESDHSYCLETEDKGHQVAEISLVAVVTMLRSEVHQKSL